MSEFPRHIRQVSFPPIGAAGQAKLRAAKVLLVGLGALGTRHAELLVRAGVGSLTLVDRDVIELSNLQRQTLFTTADLGRPKALTAAQHLNAIDPEIKIDARAEEFSADGALAVARGHDLILDGTDNFETRFLINETALELGIPWVMAAVVGSDGQMQPIVPRPPAPGSATTSATASATTSATACLVCLLEEIPSQPGPTCETAGVIGPAVAAVSALACAEALKILTGDFAALSGPVFFDLWRNQWQFLQRTAPRADCAACARGERPLLNGERGATEAVRYCGTRTVQIRPPRPLQLDFQSLQKSLPAHYQPEIVEGLLRLRSGGSEFILFPGGRALVRDIDSPEAARRLYAQILGV